MMQKDGKDNLTRWHQWVTVLFLPLLVGGVGWCVVQLVQIPVIQVDLAVHGKQLDRITERVDRLYEGLRFGNSFGRYYEPKTTPPPH